MHNFQKNDYIMINISLKYAPVGPIDSKSVLVQVVAWFLTGSGPLPELMLIMFYDVIMHEI